MRKFGKLIAVVIACCMLLPIAAFADEPAEADLGGYTAENPLIIRMATMDSRSDNSLTNGNGVIIGDKFIELITEVMGDSVQITFYTDQMMGNDGEVFESVTSGTLEISDNMSSTLAQYAPDFKVLDLPYLFEGDWPHLIAFVQSDVAKDLAATLNAAKPEVMCLGIKANGPRNVSNNKTAVKSVEDMKGLQLRVQSSDVYTAVFEGMGAVPVPMSGSELFTALQQGTVDGEENNPVTDYAIGLAQLTKYYSETRHIQMFSTLCCNSAWFNSLPESVQTIVADCALQACIESSKAMEEKCAACVDAIASEMGSEVVHYEEIDIDSFKEATASVYEKFPNDYIEKIKNIEY